MGVILPSGWRGVYVVVLPFVGFSLGYWLDQREFERMSSFRGKSKLYGREYAPGERPPWP